MDRLPLALTATQSGLETRVPSTENPPIEPVTTPRIATLVPSSLLVAMDSKNIRRWP